MKIYIQEMETDTDAHTMTKVDMAQDEELKHVLKPPDNAVKGKKLNFCAAMKKQNPNR